MMTGTIRLCSVRLASRGWLCLAASLSLLAAGTPSIAQDTSLVSDDPAVQRVLALRRQSIEAITAGRANADADNYSSTFVANTPGNGIVLGKVLLAMFADGSVGYSAIEQHVEYAAAHGEGVVVLMGTEIVVPTAGLANAGKRVHRRFTDVFRLEQGAWKHDLRHTDIVRVEE